MCIYLHIFKIPGPQQKASAVHKLKPLSIPPVTSGNLRDPIFASGSLGLTHNIYDYRQLVCWTIHKVLAEFHSARVPREYVFDLFPPLKPWQFSVMSSVNVGFFFSINLWYLANAHTARCTPAKCIYVSPSCTITPGCMPLVEECAHHIWCPLWRCV